MGVKFGREYNDIIKDLAAAIPSVEQFYTFLEMEQDDWNELDEDERAGCLQTMADDLFFGLGSSPSVALGSGQVRYEVLTHRIVVQPKQGEGVIISLI